MADRSDIINLEVLELYDQILTIGPKWDEKVPKTNHFVEMANRSIFEIDDVLTDFRFEAHSTDLSFKDTSKLQDAIFLVFKEQGLSLRPDGRLYPIHPLDVANKLITKLGCTNPGLWVSGLLHDVVEDVESYNKNPDRIGVQFGQYVQEVVQGMTNKLAIPIEIKLYESILKRQFGIGDDAVESVIWNLFYFRDIQKKLEDPRVLAVKSCDFHDNIFSLTDMVASDFQLRLANKYLPVVNLIVSGLNGLTQDEIESLSLDSSKVRSFAREYVAGVSKVEVMAKTWKHHDLQNRARDYFCEYVF